MSGSAPPPKGTYLYGRWLFEVKLTEIGDKLEGQGMKWEEVKQNDEFKNCKKDAVKLMYDKHPKKSKLPIRHTHEFYYWYMMEKRANQAKTACKIKAGREHWKAAWEYYCKLEAEQIKVDGSVHPRLLPPGLPKMSNKECQSSPPPVMQNAQCQTKELNDVEVQTVAISNKRAGPNHTEINLGYVTFQLPLERDLAPLDPPFVHYRPEEHVRTLLQGGGCQEYGTIVRERSERISGCKLNPVQRVRIDMKARKLMQNALNCIGRASTTCAAKESVMVSNLSQGHRLIGALHRRLCSSMCRRVAPSHVPKPMADQSVPMPAIFREEEEEIDFLAADPTDFESVEQTSTAEKLVLKRFRMSVGMTRDVFGEIEKVLLHEKKDNPAQIKRFPKKKIASKNFIKYSIENVDCVRRFFAQALDDATADKILVAQKDSRRLEAVVSKKYPCFIRHQSQNGTVMSIDICFG